MGSYQKQQNVQCREYRQHAQWIDEDKVGQYSMFEIIVQDISGYVFELFVYVFMARPRPIFLF